MDAATHSDSPIDVTDAIADDTVADVTDATTANDRQMADIIAYTPGDNRECHHTLRREHQRRRRHRCRQLLNVIADTSADNRG